MFKTTSTGELGMFLLSECASCDSSRLCCVSSDRACYVRLPEDERCAATQRLIVDIELMAQADYFVGSETSGMYHLASRLRKVIYNKPSTTSVSP